MTHKTPHSFRSAGHTDTRSSQDYWLFNTSVKLYRSVKNRFPVKLPGYPEGLTEFLRSRAKLLLQVSFWKLLNELEPTANHVVNTIVAWLDRANQHGTPDVLGITRDIQVAEDRNSSL